MPARHHRVTRGDDYRRIVRKGNRVGGALCITYAVLRSDADEASPARFGYIASKAVGNAVTRNLVRRRLKTITERMLREGISDVDIVIRAFPAAAEASFAQLEADVRRVVTKLTSSR